jgi:hypothetical protein
LTFLILLFVFAVVTPVLYLVLAFMADESTNETPDNGGSLASAKLVAPKGTSSTASKRPSQATLTIVLTVKLVTVALRSGGVIVRRCLSIVMT